MKASELLLSKLDGVRAAGQDHWRARCPAHESKSTSLSIQAAGDRVLLTCFAGCSALEILDAIGLQLNDLFDQRLTNTSIPHVRQAPFPVERMREMLHCALVIGLAAGDLKHGKKLCDADQESLLSAIGKLTTLAAPVENWPRGGEG